MKHTFKFIQEYFRLIAREKKTRLTPQEVENKAFSESMRRQFLSLKEKGLTIRIVTL